MKEAWVQLGQAKAGGILLIGDHAANAVPDDIDLGIDAALLDNHIAIDIGVAEVASMLVDRGAVDCAVLGGVSRLVIDLNREEDHAELIPTISDGHRVVGNDGLSDADRASRLARFFRPYHARLDAIIEQARPAFILSLHSFTPALASNPGEARPWDVGVLYNEDARLAGAAVASLSAGGWCVGDQQPYSGKALNATMNRHAEARGIAYIGIEMRQDHVANPTGQRQWADELANMCRKLPLSMAE